MSLFVGNISRSVTSNDLEKEFGSFGPVKINYKGSYSFAEFDHEKDAEDALESLQAKDMGGRRINIEWSKKSRKFDDSKNRRRRSVSRGKVDDKCFNCGIRGHYSRDCRDRRRKHRSRSRSHSRRRRSSSRDRRHKRRRSRSSSRSRSRSRSRSYKRRSRRDHSRSRSRSPESSRDRSRDDKHDKRSRGEQNGHKIEKIEQTKNTNDNKRESRSSSRRSDRSPRDKSPNKNIENIGDILDKDMITDKYKEGRDERTSEKQKFEEKESVKSDYNKFKVDDLKNELKKRNLSYSRNAKKSDLIDVLSKNNAESGNI